MRGKRILAVFLALCMVIGILPMSSQAAEGDWAYVKYSGGEVVYFKTFPAAWNAAAASDRATVGLLNNWDGGRFEVPEGRTIILELNGYVLTRDLSSGKANGEVLWVGPNASLYVYGGKKDNPSYRSDAEHNVNVYVAKDYSYERQKMKLCGGIINGGYSSDAGGGIHMKEGAKVYLYNVTVAGNGASAATPEYGDGGGIEMDQDYGYLYLKNSNICYNIARYDGGGVHVDSDFCTIDMVNSHIHHNLADDNGGGIYVDGDSFKLRGDAVQIKNPEEVNETHGIPSWNSTNPDLTYIFSIGSSVSYNRVFDSEDGGGGIHVDNPTALIEGINVIGNVATDKKDGGNGGGIYMNGKSVTVRGCNILRNKADIHGGGVYSNKSNNSLDNCTVWNNLAMGSGGTGGGVYTEEKCNFAVSGTTIVRWNVSKDNTSDNLYLSQNADMVPALTAGADVKVRTSGDHNDYVSVAGTYDDTLFDYDNYDDKHIEWDRSSRRLKVVNGSKPTAVLPVTFTPSSYGKRTNTIQNGYTADNGTAYDLIKGIVSYPSFPDENADIENIFYYSDGFFDCNTNTYNPHLATASMCLAGAAGYSNEYGKDDSAGSYLDKSQNFRQFVSDIGCADEDIYVNDFNTQKPGADTIGVGIASKPIFGDKTLVIIGVRGMGYESEWISNMTLGAEGEAAGWSSAATQVMAELKAYLERKDIDGSSESTIFWIAGYSRAGATSNLTAKRIVDAYDNQGTHTFAYPLEAPMGGVESAKVAGNNYNCIHNVINQNDIVPWTGTTEMGFIRYGVDHFIPGSPELKSVPSDGGDNNKIPEDNTAWNVESTNYNNQRTKMLAQLAAVNPDIIFDDYFHVATVSIDGAVTGWNDVITEYNPSLGKLPSNTTTESFVQLFFEKLQEYAFKYDIDEHEVGAPYNNPRAYFSQYKISNDRTFQQAAASTAALIFGKSAEDTAGLMECFGNLAARMDKTALLGIYLDIFTSDENDLPGDIDNIWKKLVIMSETDKAKGYHSIDDYLTLSESYELRLSFRSLLFPLLVFVAADDWYYNLEILGTMGYNIPRIIANHYPEVTHAWLRSYDSLYAGDTVPVKMDESVKTAPSKAAVQIIRDGEVEDTIVPSGSEIVVEADDVIRLIPSDSDDVNRGEAIYYQIITDASPVWHAYADPLRVADLAESYADNGIIRFKVIAAHNGVKLDAVEFRLRLSGTATVSSPYMLYEGEIKYSDQTLVLGQSTTISFSAPHTIDQYRFKRWEVYYYEDQTVGRDIGEGAYIEYFGTGFDAYSKETTVTNCKGISARFVPVYEKAISILKFSVPDSMEYELPPVFCCEDSDHNVLASDRVIFWEYNPESQRYVGEFHLTLPEGFYLADMQVIEYTPDLHSSNYNPYGLNSPYVESEEVSGREVTYKISFRVDNHSGGQNGEYLDSLQGTLNAYDRNTNGLIKTYKFDTRQYFSESNPVTAKLSAPFIEDMKFVKWSGDLSNEAAYDSSIQITEKEPELTAYYDPIVNVIEVTLDKAVVAGEPMPVLQGTTVTITNRWGIEGTQLTWNRPDKTAGYYATYAARITVDRSDLKGRNLDDPNSEIVSLTGKFDFADQVKVIVRDENGIEIPIAHSSLYINNDVVGVDIVFNLTDLNTIVRFEDVDVTVHFMDIQSEGYYAGLPKQVNAYLEDGWQVTVPVRWTTGVGSFENDDTITQINKVTGEYDDDLYNVADGVTLKATRTILPTERTQIPTASPEAGSYNGAQKIALNSEEGADIYYLLRYEGVDYAHDPTWSEFRQKYTEPILLNDYTRAVTVWAYADKDGKALSDIVSFQYKLTKLDVTELAAKDPMIAENGNIDCRYCEETGQYFRDEDCEELLDYDSQVCVPAFIRTSHEATTDSDEMARCFAENDGTYRYSGFEMVGVQTIGTDGEAARVVTVLDSRILDAATDYGYLFTADDADLTYESATYKYSCKEPATSNTLYSGDYCYVTARISGAFLDPDMRTCFYVKLENGVDYIYTDVVACKAIIRNSDTTDSFEDNIVVEGKDQLPEFKTQSLILSGQIGVNFYMDLDCLTDEQRAESYVEFTISGKNGKTQTVPFDADHMNRGKTYYGFTCKVNSVQMADTITAVYHYNDADGTAQTVSKTYTVETYLNSFTEEDGAEIFALIKAINDYGYYAQQYLSQHAKEPWTLDVDHAAMAKVNTTGYNYTENDLAQYAIVRDLNADLKAVTYSLSLDTDTAINLYIEPAEGYTGTVSAKLSDGTVLDVEKKGNRYRVTIAGVSAHLLGKMYEVKITTEAGESTVKVSALSYAYASMDDDDPGKTVMSALYDYYLKALAYQKFLNN